MSRGEDIPRAAKSHISGVYITSIAGDVYMTMKSAAALIVCHKTEGEKMTNYIATSLQEELLEYIFLPSCMSYQVMARKYSFS